MAGKKKGRLTAETLTDADCENVLTEYFSHLVRLNGGDKKKAFEAAQMNNDILSRMPNEEDLGFHTRPPREL